MLVVQLVDILDGTTTAAFEVDLDRRDESLYAVPTNVEHNERVRIKHHHVLYPLRQVEPWANLQILGFIALADHFYHRLGDQQDCLFFLIGLAAKNGDIRALQRTIREADVDIRRVDTSAVCLGLVSDDSRDARAN